MTLDLGEVRITWGQDGHGPFVVVAFEDGAETMARPLDEPWEATRLHDPLHALLAAAEGRISATLWRVAHGLDLDLDEVSQEEARVLAVQALLLGAAPGG